MADIDLEGFSLKELKELQVQVNRAIATFEDRRKNEALAKIEEAARDLGFSLSELTGFQAPKKRKPATAKYANPADAEQTWTGRGRRPRWVEDALAEGKELADLEI